MLYLSVFLMGCPHLTIMYLFLFLIISCSTLLASKHHKFQVKLLETKVWIKFSGSIANQVKQVLCYSAKTEVIQEEQQWSWSRPLSKLLGHLIEGGQWTMLSTLLQSQRRQIQSNCASYLCCFFLTGLQDTK